MRTKEVVAKIRNDYKKMNTLKVNHAVENEIDLIGMRYEGREENFATERQIDFLSSFDNVSCYKDNLADANKWFLSACIAIAKEYPEQFFYIHL